MKQVLQNLRSGETSVVEVPVPTPQAGEILVRTAVSLVSAGTERNLVAFAEKSLVGKARSRPDLVRQLIDKARREGMLSTVEAAFGRLNQPMPLGYSSSGTIVALGPGVEGLRLGQRVACAGGGYAVHAEYVTVPRNLICSLPDEVDFESGAFTTLGAIALHGFRLAEAQIGSRVAVIGLGLLGLLTTGIAQAAGCSVLGIDLDEKRVALGRSLGAQAVLREHAVEAGHAFSKGAGCDAVLICADTSSDDPVELAGELARDRAHVVAVGVVGLNLPNKPYFEKEITFLKSRSYGPGRYDPGYEEGGMDYPIGYVRWTEGRNLEAYLDLLATKQVDVKPLITHHYPVEDAVEAYELIGGKRPEPFLGVLLHYSADTDVPLAVAKHVVLQDTPINQYAVVRLGVLGAGNFANAVLLPAVKKVGRSGESGRRSAEGSRPGIDFVGIASASGTSARHSAQRFGFRYAASDYRQILDDPDINTVAILTRHNLHARLVVEALKAGKHVFCEKPLALDDSELDEVEKAIRDANVQGAPANVLMVGFNRRFAPMSQQLKKFLEGRKEPLVATYRINGGYIPLEHWLHDPNQGGGRIIGEGCHFIDFLTFLVGSLPKSVSADGLPDNGRYHEDNVVIRFQFADGSLGIVTYLANGDKAFPKERVEVFCGGRAAALDDFRSIELVMNGHRQTSVSRLRQDKGHRREWQLFLDTIHSGGPPPIPYDQLFGVTRATFRVVESLREGKTIPLG